MAAERRLAAILFTDIVGYTALWRRAGRRGCAREPHRALVQRHNGDGSAGGDVQFRHVEGGAGGFNAS
jgi:hypothetical protein